MTDRRRDGEITRLVSARSSRPLVASHPVYQYPARRYQLNVVSLHWEPDEPSQRPDVAGAGGGAWRRPARFMLWEDQRMAEFGRRLQGMGVRNVVYSPCRIEFDVQFRGPILGVKFEF